MPRGHSGLRSTRGAPVHNLARLLSVFGLTFSELAVVLVVGLVVLGPRDLPCYLRTAGQVAGRARDWTKDLDREQLLFASAFALLAAMAVCWTVLSPHVR